MATTIHDGNKYISAIQLPNPQGGDPISYEIHDAKAVHDLGDLGLSTPLNFKGVVEYYSDLIRTWGDPKYSSSISYEQTPGASGSDMLATFPTTIDFTTYSYPLRIIYRETYNADVTTVEEIVNTAIDKDWRGSTTFQTSFDYDSAVDPSVCFSWSKDNNQLSLRYSTADTLVKLQPALFDNQQNNKIEIDISESNAVRTDVSVGDVYLVRSTGQEYVCLERTLEDGTTEKYWEPLGSVHDAASSKHTHKLSGSLNITSPTLTVTQNYSVKGKSETLAAIETSGTSQEPYASTWVAQVSQDGVLSFIWEPIVLRKREVYMAELYHDAKPVETTAPVSLVSDVSLGTIPVISLDKITTSDPIEPATKT